MGMYTELVLNFTLEERAPDDVIAIVKWMFTRGAKEVDHPKVPDHEFFETDRWQMLGTCSSFYFTPLSVSDTITTQRQTYVSTRSDLKNYDSEINKFLEWIRPYIDASEKQFLGYYRYEENDHPTLLYYSADAWIRVEMDGLNLDVVNKYNKNLLPFKKD